MLRRFCSFGLAATLLLLSVASADAITRVGKKYNVLEFGAGYASPYGHYDNFGGEYFIDQYDRFHQLNADQVFKSSYSIGVFFGQLRNRWMVSVGGVYTKVNQLDTIVVGNFGYVWPYAGAVVFSNFGQWDLRLDVNYQFMDISENQFTPYAGIGLAAGLISETAPGIDANYDANTLLSANFGVEFKLWTSADKRKFVTLASVNSYDLLSSGYRPRNLNIGGAIKVYMRP
ncbi:hypothetical protein C3F09_01695 [candidate division GN15 bacterium]|uniref:Outer membrane protein beta-barrel domain-containing protein n=1 Tax=candidate division GN15 bacterium TaxID=2072418 RepID=A0A855X5R2_9BACT|nr:MAG: hypothetical protein C3F09_01695 [candidate division GN15 bacterium]